MNSLKEPLSNIEIPNLLVGTFRTRLNRFVGEISYRGTTETAHIHDPGRLTELLIKGAKILFTNSRGKLKYYIKAVKIEDEWVLIDSALHSRIAMEIFRYIPELSRYKNIKKEVKLGKSRIDFTLDDIPLEVKGCTLVRDGLALFPDAPTERGLRHVEEIIKHKGIILFLIFRKANEFCPNWETDQKFSQKLSEARQMKVPILAARISFDSKTLSYRGTIPLAEF
jgi:sugar fermentation stimulation protein A